LIALGRPVPAINQKPAAKCEIQTTVQQQLISRPDNHKFRDFSLPHLHLTPPLGGSRWKTAMLFSTEKLEWCGHPNVKNVEDMFIRFDTMHERDTHTQTPHDGVLTVLA